MFSLSFVFLAVWHTKILKTAPNEYLYVKDPSMMLYRNVLAKVNRATSFLEGHLSAYRLDTAMYICMALNAVSFCLTFSLSEKFYAHSQPDKARALSEKFGTYMRLTEADADEKVRLFSTFFLDLSSLILMSIIEIRQCDASSNFFAKTAARCALQSPRNRSFNTQPEGEIQDPNPQMLYVLQVTFLHRFRLC